MLGDLGSRCGVEAVSEPVIVAEGVSVTVPSGFVGRPTNILHHVDIVVARGAVHGFVGANGAGKSTTMRTLIGAVRPSGGRVTIMGKPPSLDEARRAVGYAPDIPSLPRSLTGMECVQLHAGLIGCEASEIGRVLELVKLTDAQDTYIARYSKGMQQRLSLATAMLGRPPIVILDEPMSGLDPWGRDIVRHAIQDMHTNGATVLFSSHVIPDVELLCDTVTLIAGGRTVLTSRTEEITGPPLGYSIAVSGAGDKVDVGSWRTNPTGAVVDITEAGKLAESISQLSRAGWSVQNVDVRRESLEQRLLQLMGPPPTEAKPS